MPDPNQFLPPGRPTSQPLLMNIDPWSDRRESMPAALPALEAFQ